MNKKHFANLRDMVPHTEVMKKGCMYLCLKCLHFGVMALLNFRTFEDNNLSGIRNHILFMYNGAGVHLIVCVKQHKSSLVKSA
jgi:hypothetical protein